MCNTNHACYYNIFVSNIFVSIHANTIPAGYIITSMHAQMRHILNKSTRATYIIIAAKVGIKSCTIASLIYISRLTVVSRMAK